MKDVDYGFDDSVRRICENLGVDDEGTVLEVVDLVEELAESSNGRFRVFGGYDALTATGVFIGLRHQGMPFTAEQVFEAGSGLGFASAFSPKKIKGLRRKVLREELDLNRAVFRVDEYIKFFSGRVTEVDRVNQAVVADVCGVSRPAIRYTYKDVVEGLTGVDTANVDVRSIQVTPESFEFFGDGVESFALHLAGRVDEELPELSGRSPRAVAAACLYVAAVLLRGEEE